MCCYDQIVIYHSFANILLLKNCIPNIVKILQIIFFSKWYAVYSVKSAQLVTPKFGRLQIVVLVTYITLISKITLIITVKGKNIFYLANYLLMCFLF